MASISWTLPEVEHAIDLYCDEEMSAVEIGRMMGRSKDGVLNVLRANGVPIRGRGARAGKEGENCPAFTRMADEARLGSTMLLEAITRAGVRP